MTPDPVLGTWEIHVLFQGVKTIQEFVVEEYVLPRIEVTLSTPSTILITDEILPVKVCGIYSYGRPVQGSVHVELRVTDDQSFSNTFNRFNNNNINNITAENMTDSDGCAEYMLNITPLNITSKKNFQPYIQRLIVTAEFTETGGTTLTKTSDAILVTRSPLRLTWTRESYRFNPGLPLTAGFQLTRPDGSPSPGINFHITCTQDGKAIFSANDLSTDENGSTTFEVTTPAGFMEEIECRPTFPDFQDDIQFDSLRWTIINSFASSLLSRPYYSSSFSYLMVKPHSNALKPGSLTDLVLHYIQDNNTVEGAPKLNFQLLSRGKIIKTNFEITRGPEITSTPLSNYYTVNVRFLVTCKMSPKVTIVASFSRGSELVTGYASFDVERIFKHKVEMKFQTDEVEPGEYTNFDIKADPKSLCAIGVVDRSVILLGGDNRLTDTKVFQSVHKYDLTGDGGDFGSRPCIIQEQEDHQSSDDDDNNEDEVQLPVVGVLALPEITSPPVNSGGDDGLGATTGANSSSSGRRKRQTIFTQTGGPLFEDGSKAFFNSGLIYMSNLAVVTSPCRVIRFFVGIADDPAFSTTSGPFIGLAANDATSPAPAQEDGEAEEQEVQAGGTKQIVRTYFPETWLWDLYPIGDSGATNVVVKAPDTITEWVGSGFCLNRHSGIGVSDDVTLRTFKPFFIDLRLPYSVIRGEEYPLEVSIFSYLTECIMVQVTIQESEDFFLFEKPSRRICICAAPVKVSIYIQPRILGFIPIQIEAVSVSDGHCDNFTMSQLNNETRDSLRRDLLVEPEGVEEELCYNGYICPQDQPEGIFLDNVALLLPENYVPDSAKGKIAVNGDLLGPTLSNLDDLLNIPYGCGEQNMVLLVPNIFALLYLRSTGMDLPEIREKATENIRNGYQRQLQYHRSDGSFSAFGERDAEGSAWLTAFVVRALAQARVFVTIDEEDLLASVRWLRSLQDPDTGCFRNSGRVINKLMQGGVNDEYTQTAYIALTICETGVGLNDPAVSAAVGCLERQVDYITDTYAIALVAYSLMKLGSYRAMDIFLKLKDSAIVDGGDVYWKSNRPDFQSYHFYHRNQAPGTQVEITGYALLAYLAYYEVADGIRNTFPIVQWLIGQQNPRGGFSSTQDTVVALHGLSQYAVLVFSEEVDIQVTIVASPPCEVYELRLTQGNSLVQQEQEIPSIPTFIQIAATGQGCVLGKVSWNYHVFPESRDDAPFKLNHTITPLGNNVTTKYHMSICAKYTGEDGHSNMALIENRLQSGFKLMESSLNGLKNGDLKRVDQEKGKIIVYFEELTGSGDCVSYDVEKVFDVRLARKGVLTVFDYYSRALVTNVLYYIEEPRKGGIKLTKPDDCPICASNKTDDFDGMFCNSTFGYTAMVGDNSNLQLHWNEREGTDRSPTIPFYLGLEFPKGCDCDSVIKLGKPVLVISDIENHRKDRVKPNLGYLSLDANSGVIAWNFATRRATRMAREMCEG